MEFSFSLPPAQGPVGKSTSGSAQETSGWLSGAVKGMSDAFASFTAMFKPSGSSVLSQSKNKPIEGAGQKNMFSSLRNWGSSFSLRDWIPKGISLSFGKKSDDATSRESSFSKECKNDVGNDFFTQQQLRSVGKSRADYTQDVKKAFENGEFYTG